MLTRSHTGHLLICGSAFAPRHLGGLQIALHDLAAALRAVGWRTDLLMSPGVLAPSASNEAHLSSLQKGTGVWHRLPRPEWLSPENRTLARYACIETTRAVERSRALEALERRLRRERYDAVIACLSGEPPGLARLVCEMHSRAVLLSLNALTIELKLRHLLPWLRGVARVASRGPLHPDLFEAVDPLAIRSVVFASHHWFREAVQAGVPAAAGRVIYFGLPSVPPLAPPRSVSGRLLWVGRLSPEKGLHLFLDAVAALSHRRSVSLTAICGLGPESYRRKIVGQIERLGLSGVVHLHSAVPRHQLRSLYASHDLLLFQSPFEEPVALTLMEAFAAGLPVVAPFRADSTFVRPDETCVCYGRQEDRAVAAAILRTLDDAALRTRVRAAAHALAMRECSSEAMGAAYDAVLQAPAVTVSSPAAVTSLAEARA